MHLKKEKRSNNKKKFQRLSIQNLVNEFHSEKHVFHRNIIGYVVVPNTCSNL